MNKTQQQTKDWQFYKISVVVAGQEPMVGIIDEYINKAIGEMADAGTGLYSNETDVKKEDERLDACLGANALEINRSISFYYNELETRGIVGEGQLFGNTAAEMLFYTFGKMVELLQMDASSPMKMRNDLAEIIKLFDEMPIMGLLYQILLLQGLAFVLERLKVDEGDAGFDEALLLYRWLMKLLGQKEMRFCFMQYGENDLKLLKPFCDFLMSTDMGQCVQSVVFKTNAESEEPQAPQTDEQQTTQIEEMPKPTKGRGRPVLPLKSKMLNDSDGKNWQKLHELMDGKKRKDAVLIIFAFCKKGWMIRPSYKQVINEFGNIVCKSMYDEYTKVDIQTTDGKTVEISKFSDEEIASVMNALQ